MDQNVAYYQTAAIAPRSQSSGVGGQGSSVSYLSGQGSTIEFHPTTSAGFTTNANTFHGGETTTAAFITNNVSPLSTEPLKPNRKSDCRARDSHSISPSHAPEAQECSRRRE